MSDSPYPLSKCTSVTRRRFLAGLGATVAVASAGAYGISVWGRNPAGNGIPPVGSNATTTTTSATTTTIPGGTIPSSGNRTLVVIEMGGGNDGLNTVVPHGSARYFDLRGDLALQDPIDLDGEVGLHPALGFLAERYATGDVAIVDGIGYPDPDLSHFASMATWWSGHAAGSTATGWLGRYLDATVGTEDPLAGVAIGPGPTPALLGDTAFQTSVQDMTGLSPRIPAWVDSRDELVGMWQGFAPAQFDSDTTLDLVRRAISATARAQTTMNDLLGAPSVSSTGAPRGQQRGNLEQSIEVAAALVTSPAAPRVIYIHGWGDFDTHEGQQNRHGDMMEQLDTALRTLFAAIESAGVADRTLVVTTSEFGRRPAFNGSGTDHGTAASHFVVGTPVAGGRYGESPSLSSLDRRGNLSHTVDYRSLYASILADWLGAPADLVLGEEFEILPLFA
ncbi:MAG: DUF1501 domain-containing protein [Acidimicrobiia bacterium]|nr:DUF1501 domain-containing protein [Acidimicrobiia bacterium]